MIETIRFKEFDLTKIDNGWFDMEGNPISVEEAGKYLTSPDRIIAQEETRDGKFVSTVFLCFDHSFFDEGPLIFETMVFSDHRGDAIDCRRYRTKDEAIRGHREMFEKWDRPQEG